MEEEVKKCDIALKPTTVPPGASPFGYWDCDTKTGEWFFNDPHVAEENQHSFCFKIHYEQNGRKFTQEI